MMRIPRDNSGVHTRTVAPKTVLRCCGTKKVLSFFSKIPTRGLNFLLLHVSMRKQIELYKQFSLNDRNHINVNRTKDKFFAQHSQNYCSNDVLNHGVEILHIEN